MCFSKWGCNAYIYCRVLSIFPTVFILIPEYYGHHTGFIHCSFDSLPKDDHIFDGGLLKVARLDFLGGIPPKFEH